MRHSAEKTNGIMFVNIDERNRYFSNNPIDLCPVMRNGVMSFDEFCFDEFEG
jgi:hypothetical protein